MQIELCKHCASKERCAEMGWGPSQWEQEPDLSRLELYLTGRDVPRGFSGKVLCKLYVEDPKNPMKSRSGWSPAEYANREERTYEYSKMHGTMYHVGYWKMAASAWSFTFALIVIWFSRPFGLGLFGLSIIMFIWGTLQKRAFEHKKEGPEPKQDAGVTPKPTPKSDPRYVDAWYNKGVSLNNLGRYEESIHCYDSALQLDSHNAAVWTNKGNSLHSLDRNEEAILCFDKALELDPRNATAWANKGASLGSLGRYDEAMYCCDKALELDPRNADAWNNKGNSLGSLGRNEEAIHCYDSALQLDSHNAAVWYNKGVRLHNQGRNEESLGCFDKALELDPRDVHVWYNKALVEDILSQRQEAVRSYHQFLARSPAQNAEQIEYAHQRLREMGDK